jgi:hypothetical protein
MILNDSERVTIHGNQFIGSGATAAQIDGSSTQVTISDNFLRRTSSAAQHGTSTHVVTTNNLFWQVQQKAHSSIFRGDMTGTPQICAAADPECTRPTCRTDFDCRIPFLDSTGDLVGDDPSHGGRTPTCELHDPATGIGTCSLGVERQGLFVDNVLLDGEGPNNGPWFTFRMQRNHFENVAGQELFDGGNGTHWVWLLDNVDFNAPSGLVIFSLTEVVPSASGPATTRGLAVENNVIAKNGPPILTQHHRSGKLRPAGSSAQILAVQPGSNGVGLDAAGLRVVENTFVERPGAREWGASGPGGASIVNMRNMLLASNTVVSDTPGAINNYDPAPGNPSSGSFERNLVVATSRPSYADNLCDSTSLYDIRADSASVLLCENASARPSPSPCPHLSVLASERGRLFREPIPDSPVIDMETFQRHIVATPEDEWNAYRGWPSYDPSLLDDVLQVRAWHPACDRGTPWPASCTNPDFDEDLYDASRDNCAGVYNPDQADTDADLVGDGCDPDDDGDGLVDASDCAPLDSAQGRPDEVTSLVVARAGPDTARLTWSATARADAYDLSRGLLSALASGSYGLCLESALAAVTRDDPDVAPSADGWLYLVRGRDLGCGGVGPMGNDSTGEPIPSPCP